jgi:predicted CxxxxCH...CXXCH cytochrome family protein
MNCTGCHSGELKWKDTPDSHLDDFIFIRNANNWEDCVPCHSGATTESCATCAPGVVCCADCHDGAGPGSQTDLQWIPVGPRTNGHPRLASSEWIRHYECWTCHFKTQDTTRELTPRHSNGRRDITIDPKWNISDARPPYYDPTTQVCGNTYCHSDGRDVEPVTKGYPWGGGHKDCNACHSHDPDEAGTCVECHAYDKSDFGDVTGATQSYVDRVVDTDKSWTDNQWKGDIVKMTSGANVGKARLITSNTSDTLFIGFVFFNKIENGDTYDIILAEDEKKWSLEEEWLSAMPMYEDSTGNNPNSHFRHLFTGFSCDDCHADTVVGACVSCHDGNNWPEGDMNELAHVNGYNHVDKKKTVRFKDGGTYWSEGDAEHAERSCSGTVCHVGRDPVWGGSVDEDVVCKECHGSSVGDTDDFGKFNDIRAKIDLNQWENTGHGRPALDAQGNPNTNYPSDNPPANFPENGCWYCHDAEVLHMDEERPFRLIQHDHFNKRFEKECVFCHMVEDLNNPGHYKEDQCLVCHNDATGETLAPQLDNTPNNHAKTSDPLARMNVCSNCHRECQYETDCLVGEFCTTRDGLGTVCTETENPEIVDHYDCASCHTQPYPTIWTEPDHREFNQSGTVGGMASCSSTGCHDSNENRHNVGVEVFWTQDEVDDAQNAYLQMGVCLKCHDDDAGDQCNACHLPPNDDPSTPFIDESQKYELGYDPFWDNPDLTTVGRIKPVKAKAASFHFGHLHEDAFKDSLLASPLDTGTVFISTNDPCADDTECTQADEICGVANTCVSTKIVTSRTLTDRAAGWTEDAFIGRRAVLVKAAGPFAGEERSRPIVRNTADTIIVAPPFFTDEEVAQSQPGEAVSQDGDSYQILDVVWKGGKFCWDCHDPHGDDNIYMIQNEIATRTDGVVGKPLERARTFFDDTSTGTAYALTEPRETTQKYDGICNVCHTAGQHYTNTNGDGHNASRPCTQCHEHRFTNSHASGQSCDTCHANRPVPRHTAFGQARDCTKCHTGIINNRMNIMTQFRTAKSHHVQTVDAQGNPTEPTNKHCYACHWEATPEGVIDPKYHEGYDYRDNTTVTDAKVDLVIWSAEEEPGVDNEPTVGGRPTVYDLDGSITGTPTTTTFLASNISLNSGDAAADLVAQRGEVDSITGHCLGCHSDKNNDTEPFNLVDHNNGDCKTPRQYAWDGSSVDSRYSDNGTTTWGKYADGRCSINKSEHCEIDSDCPGFDNGEICNTYPSTARKEVTKAFSAHGNAVSGGGGFDPAAGLDGPVPNTRAGLDDLGNPNRNFNVQCYDCHSSHGSRVTGRTSSYVTFNGTYNGGNLKETQGGYGGYPSAYKASANLDPASINPYAAGAGQCFDCHESAAINTQVGSNSYTPWGYLDTFGATAPVMGYRDSNKFGDGPRGVTDRFPYKQATIMGGHLKASSPVPDPGGDRPLINGLCTPCHDPHGLSDTLSDEKKHYAVPLLKGTWMTSPYREDVAIAETTTFSNQRGRFVGTPPPMHRTDNPQADPAVPDPEGRLPGSWRTDRNTFNQEDLSVRANRPAGYDRITEDAEFFAGLCLTCHPKSSLTSDADTVPTENLTWAQKERIHRSVKGWGVAEGAEEREHSFTCSKCHAAHVSGLPRLMKTNCLNYKHRGRVIEGGPNPGGNRFGYFPNGWWDAGEGPIYGNTRTCHGEPSASGATNWPDNQSWNSVTPWEGGQ